MKKIYVVDYGLGNIGSILNMFRYIGYESISVSDPSDIKNAGGIILPGVGNFDQGMKNLHKTGMAEALKEVFNTKKIPILGICLGMQLMCNSSEEGALPGLAFIDAHVRRFNFSNKSELKTPHMGWNVVNVTKNDTVLGGINDALAKFYFVHSYYVECNNKSDIAGVTEYGSNFTSAFHVDSISGVQFHPEKSHKFGMNLFRNFSKSIV